MRVGILSVLLKRMPQCPLEGILIPLILACTVGTPFAVAPAVRCAFWQRLACPDRVFVLKSTSSLACSLHCWPATSAKRAHRCSFLSPDWGPSLSSVVALHPTHDKLSGPPSTQTWHSSPNSTSLIPGGRRSFVGTWVPACDRGKYLIDPSSLRGLSAGPAESPTRNFPCVQDGSLTLALDWAPLPFHGLGANFRVRVACIPPCRVS